MEVNATIFVQIAIFLSLLLWLSPMLFSPILQLFNEREVRINGAKLEAEHMQNQALLKSQVFDSEYAKARDSARQLFTSLKHQADQEQNELLTKARLAAKQKLDASDLELKAQENLVRKELEVASLQLAEEIVKVLIAGPKAEKSYENHAQL